MSVALVFALAFSSSLLLGARRRAPTVASGMQVELGVTGPAHIRQRSGTRGAETPRAHPRTGCSAARRPGVQLVAVGRDRGRGLRAATAAQLSAVHRRLARALAAALLDASCVLSCWPVAPCRWSTPRHRVRRDQEDTDLAFHPARAQVPLTPVFACASRACSRGSNPTTRVLARLRALAASPSPSAGASRRRRPPRCHRLRWPRTPMATASPTPSTSAPTNPRTRTASRTAMAAPSPTTTGTGSPTPSTSAPTSPRPRTTSTTTTAAPRKTTTATESSARATSAQRS